MISQLRTVANQLTLLRLIFIPFVIINVLDHNYGLALGLFVAAGISDALDGMLARVLRQQTVLGQYLDPIADKLLLSSLFLVLSFIKLVPWKFTVLVFSRDICILVISAVLYATMSMRDFRPSVFGKANTVVQVATLFLVLLNQIWRTPAIGHTRAVGLWLTFVLTLISGLHYIYIVGQRVRSQSHLRAGTAHG